MLISITIYQTLQIYTLFFILSYYTKFSMSRNHFSHYSQILGNADLFAKDYPLLNELLLSSFVNIIIGIIFYLIVSSLSYFIFYVQQKQTFTPKRIEKIPYKQQKLYDIKWSIINLLFATPLLSAVTLAYPNYSKIQYEWKFSPSLIFYLLLHYIYDQFFTYWLHRILHHQSCFRYLHLVHHKSTSITPYSGFALHPIDGFIESLPVFTSCFFIPIPLDFIVLHTFLSTLWVTSVHDNIGLIPFKLILYADSHSIHHYPWGQNFNFGKTTSVCDRLFGSYCNPELGGYGFKYSPKVKRIFEKINSLYERVIPDNTPESVKKQSLSHLQKTE